MIYTTLARIRAHSPSADVWSKLLTHLGKAAADDEPLAYSAILDAVGLDDALWCLRAEPQHADIWRMYAVRAARSVQHLMKDERSLRALDIAERHARGEATDSELDAARDAAWNADWDAAGAVAGAAAWAAVWGAAWHAAWHAARVAALTAVRAAAMAAAWDVAWAQLAADFRALLASHEALPGETCALNEWGDTIAALRERLADALREAQPFIGWTGSYPELHAKIDALLRDQEEGGQR